MNKHVITVLLLIGIGPQVELFGYSNDDYIRGWHSGWNRGKEKGYEKGREYGYNQGDERGRKRGIESGRNQTLLGTAAAYAGYQGLKWAYNRWFRNEERHIENLLERVKKTATEIIQSADKVNKKTTKEGEKEAKEEAMEKTKAIANLLTNIADTYKKKNVTTETLTNLSKSLPEK